MQPSRTLPRDRHRARGRRRRWFDWHSWFGVLAGLLLFMICWSGSFATLAHEIDWLLNPDLRVQPQGAPASFDAIYDAVRAAYPQAEIEGIHAPLYRRFAVDVLLRGADGARHHVYVDPYRLTVTAAAPSLDVQRYLRDYHRRFFAGTPGLYLVCLMSIPLLGSLLTSLVFYRQWWKKFFVLRPGRNLRGWISNLHQWLGLWTLWFILIMGITGSWYLWEALRAQALDGRFSYVDAAASAVHPLPPLQAAERPRLPFAALLDLARQARPDLDIAHVYTDRNGYFYVTGQGGELLVRHRANKLFLDPHSGELVYHQRARDLSPYWRWSDTADPLHFGDFGGLTSKLIWAACGLLLSFLCLSGVWLFARRLRRNARYRPKMRSAVAVSAVAAVVVTLSAPLPLFFLPRFGAAFSGASDGAALSPGVIGFIGAWTAITCVLALSWLVMLWRPLRLAQPRATPAATDPGAKRERRAMR